MLGSLYFMAFLVLALSVAIFIGKYTLMTILICLEMLMFFLIMVTSIILCQYLKTLTLLAVFLCFSASGAAIGLTLLVSMSRLYGNDMIKSLPCEKNSWTSDIT